MAVENNISTGSILTDDAQGQFANALKSDNSAGSQGTSADSSPGAAGASASPNGAETPGTTPSPTPTPVASEPSGQPSAEGAAPVPTGPVPYDRFREVNERMKAAEAAKQQLERDMMAQAEQQARARTIAYLENLASEHPELAPAIYGTPNPSGQPAAPQNPQGQANPQNPQDPIAQRIAPIEKQLAQLTQANQMMRRQEQLRLMEEKAEERMDTHPVFKDEANRKLGERLIAAHAMRDMRVPVEKIVDDVAKELREYEEGKKAAYIQTKKAAVAQVVPGAGAGSSAPPQQAPQKLSLQDGSTRKAFADFLRGTQTV